jgi:hypothetical protein
LHLAKSCRLEQVDFTINAKSGLPTNYLWAHQGNKLNLCQRKLKSSWNYSKLQIPAYMEMEMPWMILNTCHKFLLTRLECIEIHFATVVPYIQVESISSKEMNEHSHFFWLLSVVKITLSAAYIIFSNTKYDYSLWIYKEHAFEFFQQK